MVIYKCLYCPYEIDKKTSIISHLSRKYKCSENLVLVLGERIKEGTHYHRINDKKNNNFEKINDKRYRCNFCKKNFRYLTNYYTHSKRCVEKEKNQEKVSSVTNIETQNVHNDNSTTTNINNTLNNTQNIYNNYSIQINPYGKENLSYIDKKILTQLINEYRKLGDEKDIIYEFSKLVHFNESHPENKNIQFLDPTKTEELLLKIFEGNWKTVRARDLAERMAGEKIDQIDEHSKRLNLPLVQHLLLNEYFDEFSHMKTENLETKLNRLFKEEQIKDDNSKKKERKEYIWNGYKPRNLKGKKEDDEEIKDKDI